MAKDKRFGRLRRYNVRLEPAIAQFSWAVCPGYANKLCVSHKPGVSVLTLLTVTVSPKP